MLNKFLHSTLPLAGTDIAVEWDNLYFFLFYVLLFFFVIVLVPIIFFLIRYREGAKREVSYVSHNTALEVLWTAIPTVIVLVIFAWGWIVYKKMVDAPRNAYEIKVVAQSWSWTFQYDDGRTTTNQLFVPVNQPVRLVMTSRLEDVLHGFFVPDFRLKKDVVPGFYTYMSFTPKMLGQHQILCSQYCGTGHSAMLAKLIVLDEEQWKLWKWGKEIKLPPAVGLGSLDVAASTSTPTNAGDATPAKSSAKEGSTQLSLAEQGKQLTVNKGCVACHSDDGSKKIGPSHKGIFKHDVEFTDGTKVHIDDSNIHQYVQESVEKPQTKIVKGFEGVTMPTYIGQFSPTEMNALVEYIRSLN